MGDMDSATPKALEVLQKNGAQVLKVLDQNTNDLFKCLDFLFDSVEEPSVRSHRAAVGLAPLGTSCCTCSLLAEIESGRSRCVWGPIGSTNAGAEQSFPLARQLCLPCVS